MSLFLNRNRSTEKSAKNKADAIDAALKELGAERDDVEIEVLDEGSRGFLGIGARDARVRVTLIAGEGADEAPSAGETEPSAKPELKGEPKKETKREPKRNKPTRESLGSPEADAKKFLENIFDAMGLDVKVDASCSDGTVNINLSGANMGIVIGKRGDTLDSLQYLTSLVVNQRSDDYIKISIDTENYREKRAEALLALSNRLAEKVARTGRKFTLEPMNPYERRIIHSNLQSNSEVTTFSVGSEPYRKVVIAPKNARPYKKDGYKRKNPHRNRPNSEKTVAEKTGEGYTTTYKADFKPQQHKAEYKSFEDYLAAQGGDSEE